MKEGKEVKQRAFRKLINDFGLSINRLVHFKLDVFGF